MIHKIKTSLMLVAALFVFAAPATLSSTASAVQCSAIANKVSEGANNVAGKSGGSDCESATGVGTASISTAAQNIVNLFSLIVGIVAVIMIIFGGFRYITSGGDSGKVGNAKNSLIYAIIGLIVVALAQLIVHFVLNQTGSLTS